ncbi:EAL domain-containing protein [uncultured Sphingomonas sp.]|uniref:EAL domain-containing protein n=1 Tax=uncultured Sphingomonas sp. TaxID=158754 RepID=UPI0025906B3B|nr:EAL domain-containing protein [uncultured Sphingomonas sp.]
MRLRSSPLILLIAAIAGVTTMLPAVGMPLKRLIEPLRIAVMSHPASGDVVVVEMDARSVDAIRRWPWPRRHYAAAVDRLRSAGAATIVFDVDFSTASDPLDDRLFADAIARADGRVALPTFAQQAGTTDRRNLDALPVPALRAHASLASVSIQPDLDGIVRDMPLATVTADTPRPSLSAYIAARAGRAGQSYPIDFATNPTTIPRLSFIDVERGRFDPHAVGGRHVLIGATAIEMGDRYLVPAHGVLPGVVIQALATETLLAGTPAHGTRPLILALALLLAVPAVAARRTSVAAVRLAIALGLFTAVVLAAERWGGVRYPLAIGLAALLVTGALIAARDVARRFRDNRLTDEATGLPNQRAFAGRGDHPPVLALVQITNLEPLSAVLGADEVAQAIVRTAERLRLASADGHVYRVRSHQLAMALPTHADVADILAGARGLLIEPVEVAGRKVDVALSVGVTLDGQLATAALAAAQAEAEGVFWRAASINRDQLERSVSLMGELDAAIAAGQIEVHYQPKLALASNRIASVEALVRWRHPQRGMVPPDAFIPLAEQSDRIGTLTLHVLGIVLRDARRWRDAGHRLTAAVNISAKLLTSAAFTSAADALLDDAPVALDTLIFEVTESAAMADADAAVATLHHFRARGIAISMDDYGTGQSTLSYLQRLPLSELKIDRRFVQFAHERAADAALVRSTIELAHALRLTVVAEGIEEAETLALLTTLRCDYAQGYFISRPLAYDQLIVRLSDADEPTGTKMSR